MDFSYIDQNVNEIEKKISAATARCNKSRNDVLLLAAIKSADADEVNYIHRVLGIHHVGENRVQQLIERWDKLDKEGLSVHFIGSLQTNKVKLIIDKVCLIHSLDSIRLAEEIQKQAEKRGIVMDVLVEINSGDEENKGGISCDDLDNFCRSILQYKNINLRGFMTMAPRCENKKDYYTYFNRTRTTALDVWHRSLCRKDEPILSMGMSESFEEAIECGATVVRVGRSIFKQNS